MNKESWDRFSLMLETNEESLLCALKEAEWKKDDVYFIDALKEDFQQWNSMKYTLIARSNFGDAIFITKNSPLHDGLGIYLIGPDISGPNGLSDRGWPDNLVYLGNDLNAWIDRAIEYGDEHSIAPGGLREDLGDRYESYVSIYRKLNPGISW